MKRLGRIWDYILSESNGIKAIIEGTRYKRGQKEVQWLLSDDPKKYHQIDIDKANLYYDQLSKKLSLGVWKHSTPKYKRQFCRNRANGGKWRDLYIPSLDDHIVAHMVMNGAMKAFTKGMHPFCCGSIPKRGIKFVVNTIQRWMRNDRQCRYFVKLDIRRFFDNIDKDKLIKTLSDKIKDDNVISVFKQIINSAPVPCPVGYYTSPWFANLYLEKLDWHIEQNLFKERRGKRIKWVRHYLRYIDDMLLIGTSKADMNKAVRSIREFLKENYGLEIKNTWEIKKIGVHEVVGGKWKLKQGTYWCDMCGYKFCKDSTILRDGIYLSAQRLAHKMHKQGYYTLHQCQSINSRIGWAEHCDSFSFINNIKKYVDIETTRRQISNVDKKFKLRKSQTVGC